MAFTFGIIIGTLIGFIISAFIQGATKNRKEAEIYNEGFADGIRTEVRNKYKRLLAFCESRQMYYKNANENRMMFQLERGGAIKAYDEIINKIGELINE